MKTILRNLFYLGLPNNTDRDLLIKARLFNVVLVIYLLLAVPFTIFHLRRQAYFLAASLLAGLFIFIFIRWRLNRATRHQMLFNLAAIVVIPIYLLNFITGGIDNNGPLWYFTFPMVALILMGIRWGSLACMTLLTLSVLLLLPPLNAIMATTYPPGFLWRFFTVYLVIYLMSLSFESQKAYAGQKVKELHGLLPICAACNKIRDDKGYWNKLENYFRQHADVDFSHGICPDCIRRLYPEIDSDEWDSEGDDTIIPSPKPKKQM